MAHTAVLHSLAPQEQPTRVTEEATAEARLKMAAVVVVVLAEPALMERPPSEATEAQASHRQLLVRLSLEVGEAEPVNRPAPAEPQPLEAETVVLATQPTDRPQLPTPAAVVAEQDAMELAAQADQASLF